eukprot:CAMPEP_0119352692 /NCGR_PEP_ID=MMETSP1334-20130426/1953_1 /TAXON_ID=127549 /ORGANISM="Calcidiscus leptoporus, Strain RCC1130" /LENGTH=307 /DNA_ID=CAMNT_0007365795 /DNA_START=1 /DNA_END=924 /DNA_ORIENTATION=-
MRATAVFRAPQGFAVWAVLASGMATDAYTLCARQPFSGRGHPAVLVRRGALCSACAKSDALLEVDGLCASVGETPILKGVDLKVKKGEVHAIMGPNGSGKSTLSKVLVGHPAYEVTGGEVKYDEADLFDLEPQERAQQGVFLAFQYPVEIPGVSNTDFLRLAVNKRRQAQGLDEYDPLEFFGVLSEKLQTVEMSADFLSRDVNSGFSGGEKKRNEILQLALLEPQLAILDETDSGLDIDALKTVAGGINTFRSTDNAIILITHYQRLLDYIKPDFVHVMSQGRIVRSGGADLAKELEADGYAFLDHP